MTTTIPVVNNTENQNVSSDEFINKKLKDLSFQEEKEFKDHESQQSPQKEQAYEHQEDQEEEQDSDYEVNEEEERDQEQQDEEDELMMDKICVQENENEIKSEEAINDENVQRELNEALDIVKNIALNEKEKIINKICDEYERENNGETLDYNTLKSAFKVLKTQMVDQDDASISITGTGIEPKDVNVEKEQEPEDQDQEQEQDEDLDEDQDEEQVQEDWDEDEEAGLSSEDEEEEALEDDEDETEVAYTTEEIRQQVEEAMQVASELGKKAREDLAQSYYESIIEATGAEPTDDQIQDVFKRMEEKLKEEAEDELFDNVDEIVDNNDEQEAVLATLNELKNMSDDDIRRQALFNLAKETLSLETQNEAKQKFTIMAQREPTQREFEDALIGFSITTFNEAFFTDGHEKDTTDANAPASNWEHDVDYDPDQDSQVSDEEETLDEKIEKLDELKQQVDGKILQKSVKAFERVFQRCPNVDEQLYNIRFLLSTEKINVPLDADSGLGGIEQNAFNQASSSNSGAQNDATQSDSGAPASVTQQL